MKPIECIARFCPVILLGLFLSHLLPAATSPNWVFEVRTSGSDTNGAGFLVGTGTKTVNGATDLVVNATTNTIVTSVTHSFVSGDQFKWLTVTAGMTVGWYQILSVAAGAATLDHSPAAVSTTGGTYTLYDGVDYSQNNNANSSGCSNCGNASNNLSTTDVVATGTTTIASATASFTSAVSGNVIYLAGGTGSLVAGWYTATYASATTVTLDRVVATGTGITMNIGGAWLTLGNAAANAIGSNKIWVQAGSGYSITSGISFTLQSIVISYNSPATKLIGYSTVRGDNGQVTITLSSGSGVTMMYFNSVAGWIMRNFIVNCNSQTTCTAIRFSSNGFLSNNKVENFTTYGIQVSGGGSVVIGNEVTGGGASSTGIYSTSSTTISYNYVHGNSGVGLGTNSNSVMFDHNIVAGNTGNGFQVTASVQIYNNTIYGNGGDGINLASGIGPNVFINNILSSNTGYGINAGANAGFAAATYYDGNCYYGNTSGTRRNMDDTTANTVDGITPYINSHDVIAGSQPLNNPSAGDFSLASGSVCKAVGVLSTWPGLTPPPTAYPDMGAVQSKAGAAGAGGAFVQ